MYLLGYLVITFEINKVRYKKSKQRNTKLFRNYIKFYTKIHIKFVYEYNLRYSL